LSAVHEFRRDVRAEGVLKEHRRDERRIPPDITAVKLSHTVAVPHSARRARIGSTRVQARAGRYAATTEMATNSPEVPTKTDGS
jgi:hypothetical protein